MISETWECQKKSSPRQEGTRLLLIYTVLTRLGQRRTKERIFQGIMFVHNLAIHLWFCSHVGFILELACIRSAVVQYLIRMCTSSRSTTSKLYLPSDDAPCHLNSLTVAHIGTSWQNTPNAFEKRSDCW